VLSKTRLTAGHESSQRTALRLLHIEDIAELLVEKRALGPLADSLGERSRMEGEMSGSPDEGAVGPHAVGSSQPGLLVLQADRILTEDIGFARRFLKRRAHWRLVVLDEERSSDSARGLLGLPRSERIVWPPDLERLARLLGVSRDDRGGAPFERAATRSEPDADPRGSASYPRAQGHAEMPIAPPSGDAGGARRDSACADIEQQRRGLRETAEREAPHDADPELGPLVEELLAAEASSASAAPRYLFRTEDVVRVAGTRSELTAGLGGLLALARQAAGPDGVVDVGVRPLADGRGVLLRIDFPPGPLAESAIDEILERAQQGARNPADELGTALGDAARAASELRSLGAEPSLSELEDGRMRLAVEFPPFPATGE